MQHFLEKCCIFHIVTIFFIGQNHIPYSGINPPPNICEIQSAYCFMLSAIYFAVL